MDGAATEEIVRVVKLCPTQALTFKYNTEIAPPKTEEPVEITAEARVMEDGPLVLKGDFTIVDGNGEELRHLKITSLCRCGRSDNPPYCDGTHRKVGFTGK